jgi:hypothetical protein
MLIPKALKGVNPVTILGYGALLSEESARLTFPCLSNFRFVKIQGMRRVFSHPHLFLIDQKLVDPLATSKLASLSVEFTSSQDIGFVAAAFEVELDDDQRLNFVTREPEYEIETVPYFVLSDKLEKGRESPIGYGVICTARPNDDNLPMILDAPRKRLTALGKSIWQWKPDSGLLPADVYLRHCLLAVNKADSSAEQSFLDDTVLVDRTTSLREYLSRHGNRDRVMNTLPPEHLKKRFNG